MAGGSTDFVAKIRASLDDSQARAQLDALTKKRTVDVAVNINNLGAIDSAAQAAGKRAGEAYAGALKGAIERGTYDFEVGKFSANSAVFKKTLSDYDKQTSALLTKAREFSDEYSRIYAELESHFNGTTTFSNKQLIATFSRLQKVGDTFKNTMREVATESTKSISALEAQTQSNRIVDYMNRNTKAAKKYGEALKQLAQRAAIATNKGQLNAVATEFRAIQSAINAEGLRGRSLFDELGSGIKQIGQYVGIYRIIRQIPRLVSNMVGEVRKVDAAMIELRKVSNATERELSKSFDAATVSAKKYGQAISDIINSQADWARLGYGVKEAQQLADVTTLLQTVGDNMTQESSAQGLISILKGYQMEASEAESIVDKLNEVANTQPIDTAGLTEALKRSVSSMAAAGNSLDETIGLITAANSVVQDPNVVGTAFKTEHHILSLRIEMCA